MNVERDVETTWVCFDNGSSPEDQAALTRLDFDLLMLSSRNLGQGPALNRLLESARTDYFLLLEDDWLLENPRGLRFVEESLAIMAADSNLQSVKLDDCHFTDFGDRQRYDEPFHAAGRPVRYFVENPAQSGGGFCFPPSVTRTEAIRSVGPVAEDHPFRRWWAESEFSARFSRRYHVVMSPDMLLFRHIGDEPCTGWPDQLNPSPSRVTLAVARDRADGAVPALAGDSQ